MYSIHTPLHPIRSIPSGPQDLLVCALVVPNAPVDEATPLTAFLVDLATLEEAAGIVRGAERSAARTGRRID